MSAVLLIPAAVGQSRLPAAHWRSVPAGVLAALASVSDPRRRRGVRHGCTAVLAMLGGARSYVGIADWAGDLPLAVRRGLGLGRRRAPSESTICRVLQRVDPDELARRSVAGSPPNPGPPAPG